MSLGGGVSPPHLPIPWGPQDSLLASPIILDLAILTELCQRVTFCTEADPEFQGFHSVLSIVAFLCKAPLVPEGTPVVNALFRQRSCIENILRYPGVPILMGATSLLSQCPWWPPRLAEVLVFDARHHGVPVGVQSQYGAGIPHAGGGAGAQCHQLVPGAIPHGCQHPAPLSPRV